jgi:hypothetical protein
MTVKMTEDDWKDEPLFAAYAIADDIMNKLMERF